MGADVAAGASVGVVEDCDVFVDSEATGVFGGDGDVTPVGAIEAAVEVEVDVSAGVAGYGDLEGPVKGGGFDDCKETGRCSSGWWVDGEFAVKNSAGIEGHGWLLAFFGGFGV